VLPVIRHLVLALVLGAAGPAAAQPPRAVVELFTSQGCSSCPPADKLAGELARDPDVLIVSLPVDYWDYLGWKDTLASRSFTARQKAYGDVRGDRQVYTPQAIISGVSHAVGSDKKAILDAAAALRSSTLAVPVSSEERDGRIRVTLGEGQATPATVLLMPLRKRCDVSISRGENKGKAVSYVNVVREVIVVGRWDGAATVLDVPAATARLHEADGYVVLLQAGTPERPGQVLGAAKGPGL